MRQRSWAAALWSLSWLALAVGCGKGPTATTTAPAVTATATATATAAAARADAAAALPTAASGASDETAGYFQRRVRARAVIGGCEERCESPERLIGTLLDALALTDADARREALWGLFDWSQLRSDAVSHGETWAEQWADVRQHQARERAIAAWLDDVAAFRHALRDDKALLKVRNDGVKIIPIDGRPDLMRVDFDRPATTAEQPAYGAGRWRLILVRRGWEWLVGALDRWPERCDGGPGQLAGNAEKGRL